MPEVRRAAIEREVQKMLDVGVIEEACSPWSNPIVTVPKPNESLRLCNDFWQLNAISDFDAYPMPRADELIERLGEARYITTLDLTKGYWQVPLAPADRPKTAFSTPAGQFQYTVLPFGLHGAPSTFQRLMDKVLQPLHHFAAAYIDDVVIHSTTCRTWHRCSSKYWKHSDEPGSLPTLPSAVWPKTKHSTWATPLAGAF